MAAMTGGDVPAVPAPQILTASGRAGEAVTLPLGQPPATGYGWVLDLPAGLARIDDSPGATPPPGLELGAASGGALRVKGEAGDYRVTARLARPWEADKPIRTVTIELHIR